jgi:hypothetical protein
MSFLEQIKDARRQVQKLARNFPHIFNEWQAWQQAERELKVAKARRDAAKKAWTNLKRNGATGEPTNLK